MASERNPTLVDVIRDVIARRNGEASSPSRITPAWWASLVADLERGRAALVGDARLAQFGARFNGVAVIVDAQPVKSQEIASFEIRLSTGTETLACAALNEPAMRML